MRHIEQHMKARSANMHGCESTTGSLAASRWTRRGTRAVAAAMSRFVPGASIVRRGVGGFWRSQSGSIAIEASLALAAMVAATAVLLEIVGALYEDDYMKRAARAAARSVALATASHGKAEDVTAIACQAIGRELGHGEDFPCELTWTLVVDTGLTPQDLLGGARPTSEERIGDMVRVRIEWQREGATLDGHGTDLDQPDEELRQVAVGVARAEPIGADRS